MLTPTRTKTFGTHSISFMGSLLWNRLPKEIKDSKSINQFKRRVKDLSSKCCSCSSNLLLFENSNFSGNPLGCQNKRARLSEEGLSEYGGNFEVDPTLLLHKKMFVWGFSC